MEVIHEPKKIRQVKRWKKIPLVIVALMVILCSVLTIFIHSFTSRSLAQTEGSLTLSGLAHSVQVVRDSNGVPHIQAKNNHDLFLAQGFIQAQDRLFQMDMIRRKASGTISEVAGDKTVNQDKFFRTLGLTRAAEKSLSSYSDESKQVLQWYTEGVNAFIKQAKENNSLPVEFTLMGENPEEWTPIDSLTILKYMAFEMGGHWERQAFNYYLLQNYPKEKALELFPKYPENVPAILEKDELDVATSFKDAVIPHTLNGSNNWVVSSDKTASGKPILANDPHLGLATPSIWYQMDIQSSKYNVSGVTIAGVPGIIVGHNNDIAWGITNTGPDVQQLYIEKRNPEDASQFLFDGEWADASVITETINIKGEESIEYEVVETRHGPIISEFAEDTGKDTVFSLRWTALDATTEFEAFLKIGRAANWKEFEKGLEKFQAPALNFVFTGKDGTIAYKTNGKIPVYKKGEDALLPLEGWGKENEWSKYIPYNELPTIVNPEKGFIATANNKIASDDYPYHISNNFAQPYRYMRIGEVLEKGDNFTTEDMKKLQMDQKNLQAQEFVPLFLKHLDKSQLSESQLDAFRLLGKWNFVDGAEQTEPLIFHKWLYEIEAELYKDIPKGMQTLFKKKGQTTDELLRQSHRGVEPVWIKERGGLQNLLTDTFKTTISDLANTYGDTINQWKWGDFHQVYFNHPLSSNRMLKPFFNADEPIPMGGSSVTVMEAGYDTITGEANHGASWRFILDGIDFTKAEHILGPGQSAHFRSEWYNDQRKDWLEGTYHTTKMKDMQGDKLVLVP
ncbi:penicillin acylase family protein [Rossellomorea aquimaris]|uniref:penicillin acylase family protein n=1 Tax=Rossellomorea aquimaris TaxID=189382 RepID=UPI003CEBC9EE